MITAERIKKRTSEIIKEIVQIRRTLHSNPELSFKEFQTSTFIQDYLKKSDIPYKILAKTGVVGFIGTGKKCVALRADIDALPIKENTNLEYSSKNDNVMHACGHDMHTAMLLGAATILKEFENEISGTIKLIFQPGEESLPGGASLMISEGVFENPKPSAIFGQHVFPEESVGKLSISDGPVMATSTELIWEIKGKQAHAAQPHLGNDPVAAGAFLINHLYSLINKISNPIHPCVLTITSFHSGNAINIIPDFAELKGILRSYNKTWQKKAIKQIENSSKQICKLYGATCELKITNGYPPLINHSDLTRFVKETAGNSFGKENVISFEPKMWAEDFAYYSEKIPSAFWFLGAKPKNQEDMAPLHNSNFTPDEESMLKGTEMLVLAAVRYLERY